MSLSGDLLLAYNLFFFLCFPQLLYQTMNLSDNQYSTSQLLCKEAAIIIICNSDIFFNYMCVSNNK